MKSVGFIVCGPGEADRYLEGTLKEFERLCDEVVAVGNNTDPKTERMLKAADVFFYRDDREWGRHQPDIKTDLLRKAAPLKPDYIVPLDADEVFAGQFSRQDLEALARTNALGYYFYIVNLWNEPGRYWPAGSFWNVRAYPFRPELGTQFLRKSVHCGLAPPYAYSYGRYAPFHVRHFGLMRPKDRAKKVERYKKYDPRGDKVGIGAYYMALESGSAGAAYDEAALQAKVISEVARMGQKDKKFTMAEQNPKKYAIVRRLKDGVELDIPHTDLERTLKTGGFELIRVIDLNAGDSVVAPPVVDEPAPASTHEQTAEEKPKTRKVLAKSKSLRPKKKAGSESSSAETSTDSPSENPK